MSHRLPQRADATAAPCWTTARWRYRWRCQRNWAAPAILVVAKKHGIDGQAAKVTADVTLNTDGGFSLAVELKVSVPGADKAKVQALVEEAHTVCPYSKATKGNIPVKLTVV